MNKKKQKQTKALLCADPERSLKFAGVAKQVREKYFASKKKQPDSKPPTQIERRMRSGGV
jgi:hypothetical protein